MPAGTYAGKKLWIIGNILRFANKMKCVRSILAVCMALLILGVTTGFSMGQHFCQGELLEVTLFGKAKPCEMEMSRSELPPCHSAEHGDESADTFSERSEKRRVGKECVS